MASKSGMWLYVTIIAKHICLSGLVACYDIVYLVCQNLNVLQGPKLCFDSIPDGFVRLGDYDLQVAQSELCHLIVTLDLALDFGGFDAFEHYI